MRAVKRNHLIRTDCFKQPLATSFQPLSSKMLARKRQAGVQSDEDYDEETLFAKFGYEFIAATRVLSLKYVSA